MTNTPKYGLRLPAQTDFYDVDDFNYNYEKIDEAIVTIELSDDETPPLGTRMHLKIYDDLTALLYAFF